MTPLTPKDASILALIAENQGMSLERARRLVGLADDQDEVLAVARLLLEGGANTGDVAPNDRVKSTAEALRNWAQGNRKLQPT